MRIGFIGAGRYARVHHRHLSRIEGTEFSVFSPRQESIDQFVAETGATGFSDVDSMLEAVDAVSIVTPSDLHADYALNAIRRNKHVFIEKPLERSLDQAEEVVVAAEQSTKAIMVGHSTRFFPPYRRAYETVKSGRLGDIATVRLSRRAIQVGGGQGWFANHERSGGALLDLAVHDFDFLLWLLGEYESVIARSTGAATDQGDDYALTTIKFDCGTVAHVESEWSHQAEPGTALEICGSKGMIEWDSRKSASLRSGTMFEQNYLPDDDPFYLSLSAWVQSAREGRPVPITAREGLRAMKLSLAAIESAHQN
jgi:UDP-N-acetylglucosamine 3-dehydrogenase